MEINAGSTGESKTAATPVRFKSEAQQTESLKTPGAQLELMQHVSETQVSINRDSVFHLTPPPTAASAG